MKCPQTIVKCMTLNGPNWHLRYASSRTRSTANAATDLQHTLTGVQGGNQNRDTLCTGKNSRTGLQIDTFRRRFYAPQFLHLLISRKALKSLTVSTALAIKDRNVTESQNGIAVVQIFKVILGDIMDVITDKSLYC